MRELTVADVDSDVTLVAPGLEEHQITVAKLGARNAFAKTHLSTRCSRQGARKDILIGVVNVAGAIDSLAR